MSSEDKIDSLCSGVDFDSFSDDTRYSHGNGENSDVEKNMRSFENYEN